MKLHCRNIAGHLAINELSRIQPEILQKIHSYEHTENVLVELLTETLKMMEETEKHISFDQLQQPMPYRRESFCGVQCLSPA